MKSQLLNSRRLLGLVTLSAACLASVQVSAQETAVVPVETTVAPVVPVETTAAPVETSAAVVETTQALESFEMGGQTIKLTQEQPEAAPPVVSNEPNRVAVNLTTKPESEIGLNWYTLGNLDGAEAMISTVEDFSKDVQHFLADKFEVESKYAKRTREGNQIFAYRDWDTNEILGYFTDKGINRDNKEWNEGYSDYPLNEIVKETVNKVLATGLKPNTKYFFKVGTEKFGYSKVGSFTTAGNPKEDQDFIFVHYTDTQNGVWDENVRNEAEFGAQVLKEAIEQAKQSGNVNFALHTGDFIEDAEMEDEWIDMLKKVENNMLDTPHILVAGNHDGYHPVKWNEHFNVPITNDHQNFGSYYSMDYNNSHIVVLNMNDWTDEEKSAISKQQLEWLEQDLAKARANNVNWIIVTAHKPLFSGSYHSLSDSDVKRTRQPLMELLDKYDVDLVLNGHDHVLSRTKSLEFDADSIFKAKVDTDSKVIKDNGKTYILTDGTHFVLPNAAGTKEYDDIYNENVEYISKVRKKLNWLTEEDLVNYRSLFVVNTQPNKTDGLSNYRDGLTQHYAVYKVMADQLQVEVYEVSGEITDLKGGVRSSKLVDSFILINDKWKPTPVEVPETDPVDPEKPEGDKDVEDTDVVLLPEKPEEDKEVSDPSAEINDDSSETNDNKVVKAVKNSKVSQSSVALLPQTGERDNLAIFGAAAMSILAGLGLAGKSAKKEN